MVTNTGGGPFASGGANKVMKTRAIAACINGIMANSISRLWISKRLTATIAAARNLLLENG